MRNRQECGPAGEQKSMCLIVYTLKESLNLKFPPFLPFCPFFPNPHLAELTLLNSQKLNPAIQFHCVWIFTPFILLKLPSTLCTPRILTGLCWLSWHLYQIHKKNTDNLPEKGNDAGFRILLLICFIFISVHVYISMGLCAMYVGPWWAQRGCQIPWNQSCRQLGPAWCGCWAIWKSNKYWALSSPILFGPL